MSLVSGWFPVTVVVFAVVAVVVCVPWEAPARWRIALWALIGGTLATCAVIGIVDGFGLLAWPVPWTFDLWLGGVLLSIAVGVTAWRHLRWRRLMVPVAVVLSLAAAGTLVNADYGYFPTWQALTDPVPDNATLQSVEAERAHDGVTEVGDHATAHGVLLELSIPGAVSHFAARPAWMWLPPTYLASPHLSLPTVELLAGSPGSTVDWLRGGNAARTADAFAAAHHGVAPILVMPDDNGSLTTDTECVDGPQGAALTYLTVDVPAWVRATFQAATGPSSLAVAGLSEGGTCAAMLALSHPSEYAAFGDYSGLAAPTVASVVDPGPTIRQLFGGSAARYLRHDPVALLRTSHFPGLGGWFECGRRDPASWHDQAELVPLARRAGLDVVDRVVAGRGHDFTLWTQAFAQSLPFLAAHLDDRTT